MQNTKLDTTLSEIAQEWLEWPIPRGIPRKSTIEWNASDPITTLIGPRRCGKTWFCFEIMHQLLEQGILRGNILYINFEDERLSPSTGEELTRLLPVYMENFQPSEQHAIWFLLDEIQNMQNWSKWARRITDQNQNIKLVLTGSSAKMLASEIATELRGRTHTIQILPFSFSEYIRMHTSLSFESEARIHLGSKPPLYLKEFKQYQQIGGYPGIKKESWLETLQEYYRVIFHRDITDRHRIRDTRTLDAFLKIQLSRFAALSSISKLEKELNAMGFPANKSTLNEYFHHAKDAFLFFDVPIYSPKVKNQLLYPKKVYAYDQGLVNAIRFSASRDTGRLLENMVAIELARNHALNSLFYYSNKHECDFIVIERERVVQAIQVCESMSLEATKSREVRGLLEAMDSYNLSGGLILTEREYGDETHEGKEIRIRPYWLWALDKSY